MIELVWAVFVIGLVAGLIMVIYTYFTHANKVLTEDKNIELKGKIDTIIKEISMIDSTCQNELDVLNNLIHASGYSIEDILQPSEVSKFNKINERSEKKVIFNDLTEDIFKCERYAYPMTSSKYTKYAKNRISNLIKIRAEAQRDEERVVQAYYVISRNIKNRKAEESA